MSKIKLPVEKFGKVSIAQADDHSIILSVHGAWNNDEIEVIRDEIIRAINGYAKAVERLKDIGSAPVAFHTPKHYWDYAIATLDELGEILGKKDEADHE